MTTLIAGPDDSSVVSAESQATDAEVSGWFHVTFLWHLRTDVTFDGVGLPWSWREAQGYLPILQSMYGALEGTDKFRMDRMQKYVDMICYIF